MKRNQYKTEFDLQWEEILREFDWEKVRDVMKHLNWTYFSLERVPTIGDLVIMAKSLCYDARDTYLSGNGEESEYSSGGFSANYDGECLCLRFVVEKWTTCHE